MTGRWSRSLLIGAASLSTLAACLAAAAILGPRAVGWVAAACLALAFAVVHSSARGVEPAVDREPYRGRAISHPTYPQFDRWRSALERSLRDRRTFDRVFVPRLIELAGDLGAAPGWDQTRTPDDSHAPTADELASLVNELERLDSPWT